MVRYEAKRIEPILRGLLRFKRVNESDMPIIANLLNEYILTLLEDKNITDVDKKLLTDANDYYLYKFYEYQDD